MYVYHIWNNDSRLSRHFSSIVSGAAAGAERNAGLGESQWLTGERLLIRQGSVEPDDAIGRPYDVDPAATVDGNPGLADC